MQVIKTGCTRKREAVEGIRSNVMMVGKNLTFLMWFIDIFRCLFVGEVGRTITPLRSSCEASPQVSVERSREVAPERSLRGVVNTRGNARESRAEFSRSCRLHQSPR